jgi:hypothetical protein
MLNSYRAFKDFGAELIENMPMEFSSLDEATMYWELVMRRLMHFITASLAMNCEDELDDIRDAGPGGKSGILNTNSIPPQDVGRSVSSRTPKDYSLTIHESRQVPMFKPVREFAILNTNPSLTKGTGRSSHITNGNGPDAFMYSPPPHTEENATLTVDESCHFLMLKPARTNPILTTDSYLTNDNSRPSQIINRNGRSFLTEQYPTDVGGLSEPGLRFGGMLNPHIQIKDPEPPHLREQGMHLEECMRWATAYTALRKKLALKQDSPDYIHAIFLWLRHKTGYIALACSQSANQLVYDAYLDDFRQVVQIAKILHAQPSNTAVFTFDLRYIPQLYFTAIRCRNRIIRKEAIGILLSRPYREGVWDSIVAGKMATTVMEIEEEGLVGDHIPEEKRVRGTMMEFSLVRRSGRLKCFLSTGDGIVIKQRDIQW